MARDGMTALIAEVRRMTGAGTAAYAVDARSYFTDDDVQAFLDRRRGDTYEALCRSEPTSAPNDVTWTRYWLPHSPVETGTALALVNTAGSVYGTADYSVDPITGLVEFTADTGGDTVLVRGRAYDTYAAGADLLEEWAGALSVHSWGVTQDQQTLSRRQRQESMLEAARRLRRRAWVRRVGLHRRDG